MSKNRGVVYVKPGLVEVRDIAYPKFEDPHGHKSNHAVILKIVSTNICGSDQHMVRGRTTAPAGLVLGHEITGEVVARLLGTSNLQHSLGSSRFIWRASCHSKRDPLRRPSAQTSKPR